MSWFKKPGSEDPSSIDPLDGGDLTKADSLPGLDDGPIDSFAQFDTPPVAPPAPRDGALTFGSTSRATVGVGNMRTTMTDDQIVAQMGDVRLTAGEIRVLLEQLSSADRERALAQPETMRTFLRNELLRLVVARRAENEGFTHRADTQMVIRRATDQAIATLFVAEQTKPDASFPDATLVRQFYDANPARFTQPKQYRIGQIYLEVPRDATDSAREDLRRKAENLADQARSGAAAFEELARTHSQHTQSAPNGGDIGWTVPGNMLPEVQPVIATMQPGDVSAPVRSAAGYHVLKVAEVRDGGLLPFDQVEAAIRNALIRRQHELAREAYVQNVFREQPTSINDIAVREMVEALSGPPAASALVM